MHCLARRASNHCSHQGQNVRSFNTSNILSKDKKPKISIADLRKDYTEKYSAPIKAPLHPDPVIAEALSHLREEGWYGMQARSEQMEDNQREMQRRQRFKSNVQKKREEMAEYALGHLGGPQAGGDKFLHGRAPSAAGGLGAGSSNEEDREDRLSLGSGRRDDEDDR
ncbi:hypothetical protein PROFUN_01223 [Planoprotostelium fungivorum]|uniref:Uncharacterized protein n=1 Tax=Planoprotostelium fungivorum TaxID=1890364 RepID=A0A2P6NZI7_9EUKA|nr:hypothetical protein PROFUN_01223 [Planoprotostelium fungivorum]